MIKEACVETFEEALLAQQRGAQRIELCSDLANDGLTPAYELMQKTCTTLTIPVMVMIRPRAGNFVYDSGEVAIMKAQIDQAKQAGAAGVVLGILTSEGQIDEKNTRLLADYAQPLSVTFHKAIDELKDPVAAVLVLKRLKNISRILTSGGKATALEGMPILKKMLQEAAGSPIIVIAGRVTHSNVSEIQRWSEGTEFHGRKIVGILQDKISGQM